MGLGDKQKAAAHATAARLHARDNISAIPTPIGTLAHHNIAVLETDTCPIDVSSDSDSDCGYEGGVNCGWSDSDSEDYSDADSLEELEGEELEANLNELRAELKELVIPTKYDQFMEPKAAKDWKKAEKNRTLGYTGNSKRTQERRAKEGRDREASRAEAQTS